ncbi:flavin-dependent oxidoreductase [Paenibacillus taihuensis]|uniref:Flavin-dependent oxidoreductase n=1 Tax=Paenibacillus taihuensis TaxID=1156355 RepID=A0A3D9S5W0_9BACL|nr:siderophore-interacting protein [Paenibacillus taihuensis]REE83952.1 flavin-dependent oxidoreductase [Paenibacillus taihuensis]
MGFIQNMAKRFSHEAVIVQKRQIADHTYHISMRLKDDAKEFAYTPGEFLRVLVGLDQDAKFMDMIRTYSVWNYDAKSRVIDMAVSTFSNGAGASWAERVNAGDSIYYSGPKGRFTVSGDNDTSDYYILVGDISALAHLYEIRRHLPAQKQVHSFIYADSEKDFFADLDGTTPLSFCRLPMNPSQQLMEQLNPIIQQAKGKGMVYVGGDGRLCVELNKYFRKEHGWEAGQIKTKPFWMPGKKGLE